MTRKTKKGLSLMLVLLLCVSMIAIGCTTQETTTKTEPKEETKTETKNEDTETTEEPIKLTMFTDLASRAAATINNYDEMIAYQEFQKRLNVDIEFVHPPAGEGTNQFNLMLTSQDLTDIIEYDWKSKYIGGAVKAMSDGVIIPLDEYQGQFPNYQAIRDEYEDIRKDTITDDGVLYMFAFMRLGIENKLSDGYQIRKDWVEHMLVLLRAHFP